MNSIHHRDIEERVLILTPTGKDSALTCSVMREARIHCTAVHAVHDLIRDIGDGAAAVLVAEESLADGLDEVLAGALAQQPPWSDLPVFVFASQGADSPVVGQVLQTIGNVTVMERPIRVASLVSAVRAALRARRRQYELRELFEAQTLLASIVASSDDAIISKTPQGIILSWNESAERMFGYSAAEAIGQSIALIIPPDRREEEQAILARLMRGEPISHFETVRRSKSGKLINVSLTISPIRDHQGKIIGASKVARDITDQKQSEEALREADRRKDEFLAILAHELRNPLAPIRNSIHLLQLTGSDAPAAEKVYEMLERQVNHMVRLVDDLLDVSRITRGKIELRKEIVELAAVIRSAVETSRPLIDAGSHQLAISLPPEPLMLDADSVRLAQVFANLLNNSAKYMNDGGQIWLTARRQGDEVHVSIKDMGLGIAPAMLPRIFDMFTQVDGAAARAQGGLGIGLTLVRSLIELHGGSVTVHSEGLNQGSEFVVCLPLAKAHRPHLEPVRRPKGAGILAPHRVLIVDDNHDAADTLGMLLRVLGAEVRVAYGGPAALQLLESFRPRVALLDIGMPGMDGFEVARRIRQRPELQNLTLIALTGWGKEEDRELASAAGFDHHLTKPPDIDALQSLFLSLPESANQQDTSGRHLPHS